MNTNIKINTHIMIFNKHKKIRKVIVKLRIQDTCSQ